MLQFAVTGMTCEHCVRAISRAVGAVAGAGAVGVDLNHGIVRVEGSPDPAAVRAAIVEEGYGVAPQPARG